MLLVIDEGTSMDNNAWGAEFAVPSSSEKVRIGLVRDAFS